MKTISKNAPELIAKVRAGLLSIPDASKLARLSGPERKKILLQCNGTPITAELIYDLTKQIKIQARERAAKAYAKNGKASNDEGILIGDMSLLWKKLDSNSVDLFLTDPPYSQIKLYERLAELAAAKLRPGGLCLAYSGQLYLPAILEAMGRHLTYWWTFAIEFSGQHCAIHPRHLQNKWKPVVAYAKPPLKHAPNWLTDILHGGGRDKEHHDWGQHESEVEYLIEKLTEPGQLVVDPFCGGGQIPAVCKAVGRRWMATEIDKTTALIARKRLGEQNRLSKK
jgi:hypothetical protein